MSNNSDTGLVSKEVILGSFRALLFRQAKCMPITRQEKFTAGYSEGYKDAILAMALMVQLDQELLSSLPSTSPKKVGLLQPE